MLPKRSKYKKKCLRMWLSSLLKLYLKKKSYNVCVILQIIKTISKKEIIWCMWLSYTVNNGSRIVLKPNLTKPKLTFFLAVTCPTAKNPRTKKNTEKFCLYLRNYVFNKLPRNFYCDINFLPQTAKLRKWINFPSKIRQKKCSGKITNINCISSAGFLFR